MYVIDDGPTGRVPARVLRVVRRSGTVLREQIVEQTGLSPSTVSRSVQTLVDLRLLRLRRELVPSGPKGRPSIPVQVNPGTFALGAVQTGCDGTTVAIADLSGRVVHHEQHGTARLSGERDGRWLAAALERATPPDRTLLAVGIVHEELNRPPGQAVVSAVEKVLDVPVVVADVVHAGALAEHLLAGQGRSGKTVYLHARHAIGYVVVIETDGRIVFNDSTDLSHFPSGSDQVCSCRRTGCLGVAAGDRSMVEAAQATGVLEPAVDLDVYALAADGDVAARELLGRRAKLLGSAAAIVRDMVRHDDLTFIGSAATDTTTRTDLLTAMHDASSKPVNVDRVSFGHLGHDLPIAAAAALAVEQVFVDPVATGDVVSRAG